MTQFTPSDAPIALRSIARAQDELSEETDPERPRRKRPRKSLRALFGRENPLLALLVLLAIAVAFGGGGVRYGLANFIVQFSALIIAAFYRDAFFAFWKSAPISLKTLVMLSIALPAIHAVPLPPSIWAALPGREIALAARASIDSVGWSAISADASRSLVALSGLIVPVVLLAVGWRLDSRRIAILGWAVAALGLVNVCVGAVQILGGERIASFYPEFPMPGVLFGTFANRNSTGLFLVCALIAVALLPAPRRSAAVPAVRAVAGALLLVGIVLTQSRTALVLSSIPLLLACLKFVAVRLSNRSGSDSQARARFASIFLVGAIAAAALAGFLVSGASTQQAPGRIGDTLDRFEADLGPRAYIWEDAAYASGRYWPIGSGMGTFDEVFQLDESLENLTLRRAGRAHNDYLEVAIEAGIFGLALIALWLVLILVYTVRARGASHVWVAWSGSAMLLVIALQSITDYPLRNQTMLAVGALALLMLVRSSAADPVRGQALGRSAR